MREELRTWYERELSYLRQLGTEFAGKYPKIASRLALEPDGSRDPHVERLIEAVAFLTARLRLKLEDDLPELTDSLLGILYPHYLAPFPSMATAQFHVDPEQAQLTTGYEIPRHTVVSSHGRVGGTYCRFRTAYRVELWPLEVAEASIESPISTKPLGVARDFKARTCVRVRLRTLGGLGFGEIRPKRLRIHLHGEASVTMGLYEILCGGPTQIELHAPQQSADRRPLVLPPDAVHPVGFAADEALVPAPAHGFRGYTLLEEYFGFPEKFLFVDLEGLDRACETGALQEVEVRIFSARAARFEQPLQPSMFRLGCSPLVNLFQRPAEPIWVDHTKAEYLVVPDVHAPHAHEVYAVDSVVSAGVSGADTAYRPFYAVKHGGDRDQPDVFWHATRRQNAVDGATDVYLGTVDSRLRPSSPPTDTLSLTVTCTNRDLPAQMPFSGGIGGDLVSEHIAPFLKIQCLSKPTPSRRRDVGRGAHWRLISHLSLNYLSLVEHGPDALRGILELYDVSDSPVTRRQIAGLRNVSASRVVRNVNGAFCRGLKVAVEFDAEHFAGTNSYLLASVLDRFLGLYVSINSFSQLVARVAPDDGVVNSWPPRAGEQTLL